MFSLAPSSSPRNPDRWARRGGAIYRALSPYFLWLPALISFFAYVPTLNHGVVADDRALIIDNPYLSSASGLRELWTQDLWEASAMHLPAHYYRPLPMTLFWVQVMLWGPKLWWLRLGNLLIHSATAALLPRLFLQTFPKLGIPLATLLSLCWALHPLNSEAVIWLSGRFDTLVLFLSVVALLANTHAKGFVLFPIALGFALLTKEVGIALFPAVVLADIARHGGLRTSMRAEGDKWILSAVIVGVYLALRRVLGIYGASDLLSGIAPSVFLSAFADLSVTYARLTVVPFGLDLFHWSTPRSVFVGLVALGAHLFAFALGFVYSLKWKNGAIIAGCILGSVSLALASNVGPSQHVFGDRFWSLSGIGLVLAAGAVLEKNMPIRRAWKSAGIAVIALFAALTVLRGSDWKSEERLAERALARDPNHPHWLMLSAHHLLHRELVDDARSILERVITIEPQMAKAHNALCVTELRAGRLEQAENECRIATRSSPENASAWTNLGAVYVTGRRYAETREAAEKALSIQPKNAEAEYLLAVVHANLGAFHLSERHLRRGLDVSPNHPGLRKLAAELASQRRKP